MEQLVQSVMKNIGFYGDINTTFDTYNNCNDNDINTINDRNDMNDRNNDKIEDYTLTLINNHEIMDNFKFVIPLQVLLSGSINCSNNKYERLEISPFELKLEEKCPQGLFCPYKTQPLKCPLNHHHISDSLIIPQGSYIPKLLCRYERYWKYSNGMPRICMNPHCWYNHLSGRAERLNNKCYHKI
jgi:hypothetical protein